MISAIANFERNAALGILARAAIAAEDDRNPDAIYRFPNEKEIRTSIFDEIRHSIGIAADDMSPAAEIRIGEAIDLELFSLVGKTDADTVLRKLALNGNIPSDLYDIEIIANIKNFYHRNWLKEEALILQTIRKADQEQHFGPGEDTELPVLVSLFSKFFPDKYPARSFTMLVAGQRNGLKLVVHQSWRLYANSVSLGGVSDLVDMLRRFCDKFGLEFEVNGNRSKFMLDVKLSDTEGMQRNINVLPLYGRDSKGRKIDKSMTFMVSDSKIMRNDGAMHSALTVVINLESYLADLEAHDWRKTSTF